MSYQMWSPYVPVAKRRAKAGREMDKLKKKGVAVCPVEPISGRAIAKTFWGAGWCEHLEKFSDYANRLPRGRTYVRNGSVCHLAIEQGKIEAIVSGSELYRIHISITTMPQGKWEYIRQNCTGKIGSLLQLLQGKFSDEVMQVVTHRENGLFPLPGEITFDCSCPDWAVMCKHVAAVLYGVGARLDNSPELLFMLRGVDHEELIGSEAMAAITAVTTTAAAPTGRRRMKGDLSAVFGVDLTEATSEPTRVSAPASVPSRKRKEIGQAGNGKAKREKHQAVTAEVSAPKGRRASKQKVPPSPAASVIRTRRVSVRTPAPSRKAAAATPVDSVATKGKNATASIAQKPMKLTGATIRKLRKRLNLSAAELGKKLGISGQTIYNWENKKGALKLRESAIAQLRKLF